MSEATAGTGVTAERSIPDFAALNPGYVCGIRLSLA
jgi:hypothetical protein